MSGTITSRRLAGVVSLTIDGQAFDVVSDLAYNAATVKRETLEGQSRVEGFSEMPQAGYVAFTLRDRPDIAVSSLNLLTNSTINAILANGKSVLGTSMWNTEFQEIRTQEGTFQVRFDGDVVELPAT